MNESTMKKEAKITLVGAGPGDPELLTIKGLKALQSADVVLYDALVNPVLLEEAPKAALKIYVGKRAANHRYSQEEINMLLVQYAFSHGHVVRLKGGDSFVFGRGHEELSFAKAFDIEVRVVPGISSCIAV
ncbi:MAG: SAM-dependent methyltransferase, partial [Bacteroidota bacterium]